MDKSDIQDTLVSLYLRLNGYFVSGFIVHASSGVGTEIDVLAVRFPQHEEPSGRFSPATVWRSLPSAPTSSSVN